MDTKIKAKKHLWQNFLRNKNILASIVWVGELSDKHIIEIGPGPGDLTEMILIKKPLSLDLIEIDTDMFPLLEQRFNGEKITINHNDVLRVNIQNWEWKTPEWIIFTQENTLLKTSYHVYGNIPYYITSPILRHFLYEVSLTPETITVTMQKEVADRILARDGKNSVLSLSCQLMADVEKICDISPNNFVPAPKVWSTCLKFTLKNSDSKSMKKIPSIIEKGFSQKRKKLISNLSDRFPREQLSSSFRKLWIDENTRAEDLSQEQWIALSGLLFSDS